MNIEENFNVLHQPANMRLSLQSQNQALQISTLLAQVGVLEKQIQNEKHKHSQSLMAHQALQQKFDNKIEEVAGLSQLREGLLVAQEHRERQI